MINLSIILIIHLILLLLFPIGRRMISEKNQENMSTLNVSLTYLLINILFPLLILILFLIYYLQEPTFEARFIFNIANLNNFSFALGLNFSIIQVLIYSAYSIGSASLIYYVSMNKQNWNNRLFDTLTILSGSILIFILSPNFFQFLLFLFICDLVFIVFIKQLLASNPSEISTKSYQQSIFNLLLGDLFILVSLIMLLRRTHTFDFLSIIQDINLKFFLFKPYFLAVSLTLVLGLIIKLSLPPFHSWKLNVINNSESWFSAISLNISTSILTIIFASPYLQLIENLQNLLKWLGLVLLLLSSFLAFILKNFDLKIDFYGIFLISFILFSLGFEIYTISIQILIVLPFILSNLIACKESIIELDENIPVRNNGLWKSIFVSSAILLPAFVLVGIPPFSSILIVLPELSILASILWGIFLTVSIISIILVFISVLRTLVISWKNIKRLFFTPSIYVFLSLNMLFILLISLIFPYFNLLSPFEADIVLDNRQYLYSSLPIGISYVVIIVMYLLLKTLKSNTLASLINIQDGISTKIEKLILYDFIFKISRTFYVKIILPTVYWFNRTILVGFFINILLKRFLYSLFKLVKRFIKKILIPRTKAFFVFLSNSIRKVETTTLKGQIYVLFFVALLLLIVVIFSTGGLVS